MDTATAPIAQAIASANDTIYGLNASVFTNGVDRAYAAARAAHRQRGP